MSDDSRLYTTLGLSPGAPSQEIKRAYRNLARRYHPDVSGDPGTEPQFKSMVKAYKTLISRRTERTVREASPVTRASHSRKSSPVWNGSMAGPDIVECGTTLASCGNPDKRAQAAESLGLCGKLGAWVFLRKGLYDSHEQVIVATVKAIAVLGIMQSEGELASLYERSGRDVRNAMLDIAEATGERLFSSMLVGASTDSDDKRAKRTRQLLDCLTR